MLTLIGLLISGTPARGTQSPTGSTPQKRVLVLYSTSRDSQIAIVANGQLPLLLRRSIAAGIDYYSEFLEMERFRDPEYQSDFHEYLLRKYRSQRLDAIIALSTPAVDFIQKYRSTLFPDTPVVFFEADDLSRRLANATGVVGKADLAGTVTLALQLQPALEHVFVVVGTDQNSDVLNKLSRDELARFQPRLRITYLNELTGDALESRLQSLPEHSIVFYLAYNRDVAGENFHPLLFLDRVTAVANAPTYCWVDSAIGHGVVGGVLKSQSSEIEAVANLTIRILRGEATDTIPVMRADLNRTQIDWRQLRRWNIDPARVPRGAVVLFKEPGAWEKYRGVILGAIGVVLGQAALIALLLLQGVRRRQAEAALRTSYGRIRDLGARLLTAQDSERSRIAQELHDDVSQQLAMLAIDLELIAGTGFDVPGDHEPLLTEALARARAISKSVHDLSHRLHPETVQALGLVAAVRKLCREFPRPHLTITFTDREVPSNLSHTITLCLYRIAQEALLNIVKHSAASHVSIQLIGEADQVMLHVEDNGKGFEPEMVGRNGLGLVSMSERAEAVGGRLHIVSGLDAGTRLRVTVPVDGHASAEPVDAAFRSDIAATVA